MDYGLKSRIASILKPNNGRGVMLAVDHGYFLGPTEKLEVPKRTIAPIVKYCDSLMVTRGIVRSSVDPNFPVPIVLRVSGGASIIGEDRSNEEITTSIKDAIRINATAVTMSIFVGAKYEHKSLVGLGNLVNEAEEYGLPVLAVTAVGKELAKRDARYLSLSCRIDAVGKLSPVNGKQALKPSGIYLNVHVDSDGADKVENLNLLKDLVDTGKLKRVIDRVYPFEQIVEAHRYVEAGHNKGNVVITLDKQS